MSNARENERVREIIIENHVCLECKKFVARNRKVLGYHAKNAHNITFVDYVKKHFFPDGPPACLCNCGEQAAWNKQHYTYNDYVNGHNRQLPETLASRIQLAAKPDVIDCRECGLSFKTKSSFSGHLQHIHHIKSEDYTIKHFYGGQRPSCAAQDCLEQTRFVVGAYVFKQYCKKHAKMAMSIAGKRGGSSPSPYKGHTKHDTPHLAKASEAYMGKGNPFYGKKHTDATKESIASSKRLSKTILTKRFDARATEWECLTPIDEYESRQQQYLRFSCLKCGYEAQLTLQAFERGSLCKNCYKGQVSAAQKQLSDWISDETGLSPELSTRRVISPHELDIYLEDKQVAIEYHGLYWHSDAPAGKTNKRLMLTKYAACAERGIKLIQLFDDEWRDRPDICKSMILHALGMSTNRLGARQCDVAEIDKATAKAFLDDNHINGYTPSAVCFALMRNQRPMAVLSLRRPRSSKWGDGKHIEIARFATEKGTSIAGGLSRLVSAAASWARTQGYEMMMTYADKRFGFGDGYENVGFERVADTGIGFCWTDMRYRYDRQCCKAGDGMTEAEHASAMGFNKIWTPGHSVFVKCIA